MACLAANDSILVGLAGCGFLWNGLAYSGTFSADEPEAVGAGVF
jgi:hypothetical protein